MATELLEQTFTEAAKLPEDDLRAPADWILQDFNRIVGGRKPSPHLSANWAASPKRRKPGSTPGRQDRWNSQDASLPGALMADTKNENLTPLRLDGYA